LLAFFYSVMLHNEEERSVPGAHVCVRRAHLSAAARESHQLSSGLGGVGAKWHPPIYLRAAALAIIARFQKSMCRRSLVVESSATPHTLTPHRITVSDTSDRLYRSV